MLDLSASPLVDLQGSYALAGLANELAAAGIRVQVVEGVPRCATACGAMASMSSSEVWIAASP